MPKEYVNQRIERQEGGKDEVRATQRPKGYPTVEFPRDEGSSRGQGLELAVGKRERCLQRVARDTEANVERGRSDSANEWMCSALWKQLLIEGARAREPSTSDGYNVVGG